MANLRQTMTYGHRHTATPAVRRQTSAPLDALQDRTGRDGTGPDRTERKRAALARNLLTLAHLPRALFSTVCAHPRTCGPQKPTTPPYEMLFALLLMLIGAVLCAVLFGSVALQLAHASLSRIRFNERMRVVNESMHFYRLPRQLQDRTRERYEYAWKQYRGGQEFDELLYALSPTLKTDICVYLYRDMLRNVALFSNCEADVIAALAETLRPQFFLEGDVLCREGQAGREMYFLKCGVVTMSQKQRGILGHLDAGQYFGEMCLLSSKVFGARAFSMDKRTCTISAHTLVDVMVLDNFSLEAIVSDHPTLLTEMLQVATTRLQELGDEP